MQERWGASDFRTQVLAVWVGQDGECRQTTDCRKTSRDFDVSLTVHLSLTLANDQRDEQILF
jgi:hypothetical protein